MFRTCPWQSTRNKCQSFREKSIPKLGFVGVVAVPCPFSSHSPRDLCIPAQDPPPFSGNCHSFSDLRAFPRGFMDLGSPPFPSLGLINSCSSFTHPSGSSSKFASPGKPSLTPRLGQVLPCAHVANTQCFPCTAFPHDPN